MVQACAAGAAATVPGALERCTMRANHRPNGIRTSYAADDVRRVGDDAPAVVAIRRLFYQIYPALLLRFGRGWLRGPAGDHRPAGPFQWLGVTGIWLSPITVSPNADWGYDVADYCAVQPGLGTMEDLRPPWLPRRMRGGSGCFWTSFRTTPAISTPGSSTHAPRCPPPNAIGMCGPNPDPTALPRHRGEQLLRAAWTLDPITAQYYLQDHLPPSNRISTGGTRGPGGVRRHLPVLVRPWRGRIPDRRVQRHRQGRAAAGQSAGGRDRRPRLQLFGQRPVYNANRPEVHDVIRRWRRVADAYDGSRVLIGETPVKIEALVGYYGDGSDELHLAFNFPFLTAPLDADAMLGVVGDTLSTAAPRSVAGVDGVQSRHVAAGLAVGGQRRARKIRVALLMLVRPPGDARAVSGGRDRAGGDSPVPQEEIPRPTRGSCTGLRMPGAMRRAHRCSGANAPGGGFTDPGTRPAAAPGPTARCNVQDEWSDPASVLRRHPSALISLRGRTPELQTGGYEAVAAPSGVWAWRRGGSHPRRVESDRG